MERYRSGHNEAVLKTVWGQPHMGSNPILSASAVPAQSIPNETSIGNFFVFSVRL